MIAARYVRQFEALALAASLAGGLAVGCSSQDGSTPTTSGDPSTSQPVSSTPSSPPESSAPQHRDPYPALCRKILPKHVQVLFHKPLGPMTTGGSSDCQFTPRGSITGTETLKVYLRLHDGDKTLYHHIGDISYGTFSPLTGLGYQAKWGSTPGSAPTVVDVRDGTFTCTVIPPPVGPALTLAYSHSRGEPRVSRQAAAGYAKEIAGVCQDVFHGS